MAVIGHFIGGQHVKSEESDMLQLIDPATGLAIGTTNYILQLTISNVVDATVRHLTPTITAKTATGFTFQTQQTTDSANYRVEYVIVKL